MRKRKMTDSVNLNYSDKEFNGEEEVDEEEEVEEVRISGEPTAAVYRSVCTSSRAKKYAVQYNVPPEYGLRAPTAEQRAHNPPPGYAAIYEHQFRFGLRLPLPPFVASLLAHYKIALAQLNPICISTILGFMKLCKRVSVAPTPSLFQHFFRLGRNGWNTEGWFKFVPLRPKIVYGQPRCAINWKGSFLFFKNVTLSWNHSPILNPPLDENERPSKEIFSRFLDNANRSKRKQDYVRRSSKRKRAAVHQMHLESEEENQMIELDVPISFSPESRSSEDTNMAEFDVPIASFLKSCSSKEKRMSDLDIPIASFLKSKKKSAAQRKQVKKSSEENELTPSLKECVDASSQVPSAPSLKDMPPEQFTHDIQKCACSFSLRLQEDKEELEKVVAALELEVKDKDNEISLLKAEVSRIQGVKDNEIASLQGEKQELEKLMVTMEQEVKDKDDKIASLQGVKEDFEKGVADMKQGLKDKDRNIASLQTEKNELEKGVVAAMGQGVKDKDNVVTLLQRDRDREKFVKVVAAMVQGIQDKVREIAITQ